MEQVTCRTICRYGNRYAKDAETVGKLVGDFASTAEQMSASIEQVNKAVETVGVPVQEA